MTLTRRTLLGASGALAALPLTARGQDQTNGPVEKPGQTKNTKFAVNVEMWFGGMPFLDRIAAAADLGFPAVEFWPWRGKDLDAIKALIDERGIVVTQFTGWGFNPRMNETKNHDQLESEIRESCAAAKKLGTKMMTVIAGQNVKGLTQEEMHANVIAGLKRIKSIAEGEDVMLILEPLNIRRDHKGHCLSRSEDAIRICQEVDSTHVKINWDLYHQQITEGDLCGHMREGIDHIGYLQLADHPGRTEPGTGEIAYWRVLKEAKELGYTGYVGLECRPKDTPEEAAQRIYRADQW